MYGYIYLTINTINNKKYVGQHASSSEVLDGYIGSGTLLQKDIKILGKENFICSILKSADSAEELDTLEIEFIKEFRNNQENLYNLTDGGERGTVGYIMSEESKRKIGEASKGHTLSIKIKKLISKKARESWRNLETRLAHKNRIYSSVPFSVREKIRIGVLKRAYVFTEKDRKLIGDAARRFRTGKHLSEITREKIRKTCSTVEFKELQKTRCSFTMSLEAKEKLRKFNLGIKRPLWWKEKQRNAIRNYYQKRKELECI